MIVALAGGVGGAKLVLGLSQVIPPGEMIVIGNTGDDIELHGLRICPDLDTLTYTLAGCVNPGTGWGIENDTFNCLHDLKRLGGEDWFKLGDRDLATHLRRSHLLAQGETLSHVTAIFGEALGLRHRIVPMTEAYAPTFLETTKGRLHLQEYFVRERSRPQLVRVEYSAKDHPPTSGLVDLIASAEKIIVCPSNPLISIGPIQSIGPIHRALQECSAPVIAVSPIVAGRSLKGPTSKMFVELGLAVSASGVAELYRDWVDHFVIDDQDIDQQRGIEDLGLAWSTASIIMTTTKDKIRLAEDVLALP